MDTKKFVPGIIYDSGYRCSGAGRGPVITVVERNDTHVVVEFRRGKFLRLPVTVVNYKWDGNVEQFVMHGSTFIATRHF